MRGLSCLRRRSTHNDVQHTNKTKAADRTELAERVIYEQFRRGAQTFFLLLDIVVPINKMLNSILSSHPQVGVGNASGGLEEISRRRMTEEEPRISIFKKTRRGGAPGALPE